MCCPTGCNAGLMPARLAIELRPSHIRQFQGMLGCQIAQMYMPAWWAQQTWHRLEGRVASCRTVSCLVADPEVREAADIIRATRDLRRGCKCEIKGLSLTCLVTSGNAGANILQSTQAAIMVLRAQLPSTQCST